MKFKRLKRIINYDFGLCIGMTAFYNFMVTCTYKVESRHRSLGKHIQDILSDVRSKQEISRPIQRFVLFPS